MVKNAAAELTTYYYYPILRANLIGLKGEGIKEIAETARVEDRNHFEALVPRIYELGGELPKDMKDFHDLSGCPYEDLSADSFTQKVNTPSTAIQYGIGFEKDAILFFSELLPFTDSINKDAVEELIEEEKKHLLYLHQLREKLEE